MHDALYCTRMTIYLVDRVSCSKLKALGAPFSINLFSGSQNDLENVDPKKLFRK